MQINLDDKSRDDLIALVAGAVIESGNQIKRWRMFRNSNEHNANTAHFAHMCALLTQLQSLSVGHVAPPRSQFLDGADFQNDLLTRAEGIDPDKELGEYDPRASTPVCVHNRKFTEPCPVCQGNAPIRGVEPL